MKIALFHNSYQIRGGEDRMFELEAEALRAHGHEVVCYHIDNFKVLGEAKLKTKLQTALQAPRSQPSRKAIVAFLRQHKPDISHVHNWFPIISPSIYEAHKETNIPVVQTLHNYRLGCASANYRRDGKDCTLCTPNSNTAAIRHRCYKNSLSGSITWKRVIDRGWRDGTFTDLVDCYLCPSAEVYNRHKDMGIPEEKLKILPNACPDPLPQKPTGDKMKDRMEVVFAARLVPEKGAQTLVKAWLEMPKNIRAMARLTIIGDGPEMPNLKALVDEAKDISFAGELDHTNTLSRFSESDLLICPTLWAEPFGLTVIEAMGASIPVIASNLGGPAELIEQDKTGRLVPPAQASALSEAIASCIQAPDRTAQMGQQARITFEKRYTEQAHALALTETFEEVIQKRTHA